ncbi:MAG: LytTR family transcriptional regulator [Clostridiales Family XIII bacterium]|jgi:DNA-binding LytR/AlgR family response regulator|nr:LytTR family transcriptional regulator [Clostridiales Family XIII bacterium]
MKLRIEIDENFIKDADPDATKTSQATNVANIAVDMDATNTSHYVNSNGAEIVIQLSSISDMDRIKAIFDLFEFELQRHGLSLSDLCQSNSQQKELPQFDLQQSNTQQPELQQAGSQHHELPKFDLQHSNTQHHELQQFDLQQSNSQQHEFQQSNVQQPDSQKISAENKSNAQDSKSTNSSGIDSSAKSIKFYIDRDEYFIDMRNVLFFESESGKVFAHTKTKAYRVRETLQQLEDMLPNYFIRVSKSAILSVLSVSSVNRNIAGPSYVSFISTHKQAAVSRSYLKEFTRKMNMRR